MDLPGLLAIATHQLTPDFADLVAAARRVVFVDARADCAHEGVRIEEAAPGLEDSAIGHFGSPQALLGLVSSIFGKQPQAWIVSLPAYSFEFSEDLSEGTAAAVPVAIDRIRLLLGV